MEPLRLELPVRPPYDWLRQAAFLEARGLPGVESVRPGVYGRSLAIGAGAARHAGWFQVSPVPGCDALAVTVSPSLAPVLPAVLARIGHLFDVQCDPGAVAQVLGELAAPRPGLRLPGAADGFELLVRAVLGQQVTVRAARTLAHRFAEAFGEPVASPFDGVSRLFPSPWRVVELTHEEIASLGIIGRRAETLRLAAAEVTRGALDLQPGADVAATMARLLALPGIGDWTAQYVAMRALAWQDAFPASDFGVRKALGVSTAREASTRAQAWRPWRAYAVLHLWHSLH